MHPAKVLYEEPKTEIEINENQKSLGSSRSLGLSKFFIGTITSQTYKANLLAAYSRQHETPTDNRSPKVSGVLVEATGTATVTTISAADHSDIEPTDSDDGTDDSNLSVSSFGSSRSTGYVQSSECNGDAKRFKRNQSKQTTLEHHSKPDCTALKQFIQELQDEPYITPSTNSQDSFVSELRSNLSIFPYANKSKGKDTGHHREYSMFELIDVEDCWSAWNYENQADKLPLAQNIAQQLQAHPTSNVIRISFGKIHFNCHRIILRYAKLFRTLEWTNFQLPAEHCVTPIAFIHFYQFAMGVKPKIQAKYLLDVLRAAEELKISKLQLYCMQLLDSELYHEYNAFIVFKEAKRNLDSGMQLLMLQRIWKFFLPFVATQYFRELEVNDVCRFLEADTIGVNSEIEIFYAAVLWLSAKWKKRHGKILERVMGCVRYGLLPPWFTYSLKRGTGIPEVDRVLESKFVSKLIEDGASIAATIGLYFVEPSKFESILHRLLPKVPKQRNWVFDRNCTYHYGAHEKVSEAVDFIVFKDYLKILEMEGQNYWRHFEEADESHLFQIFSQKFSDAAWSKMQF